jgi:hypothetical protein
MGSLRSLSAHTVAERVNAGMARAEAQAITSASRESRRKGNQLRV